MNDTMVLSFKTKGVDMVCVSLMKSAYTNLHYSAAVDCGTPPTMAHGQVQLSASTYQHVANYTCHTGYEFSDKSGVSTQCTADGTWQPDILTQSCQGKMS